MPFLNLIDFTILHIYFFKLFLIFIDKLAG